MAVLAERMDVTPLAVRRRLQDEKCRAETACGRVRSARQALIDSISDLQRMREAGGMDVDAVQFVEARITQKTIELSRFDRDVGNPAEEIRQLAIARLIQFDTEIEMERRASMKLSRRERLKRSTKRKPLLFRRPRKPRLRVYRMFMSLPN